MNLWRVFRPTEKLDESGATVIEYAFVAVLISIAAFSVLVNVGASIVNTFQTVSNSF